MDIASALGQFARTHEERAAFLALIGDLLPALVALNFVVVAHLWRRAEVSHCLLPWRAVADSLPPVTHVSQQVCVLVNEGVFELLFVLDDGSAETDRADPVVGHTRRNSIPPPNDLGFVTERMRLAELR